MIPVLAALIIFGLDLYAFQGVKVLLSGSSDAFRFSIAIAYWLISVCIPVYLFWSTGNNPKAHQWSYPNVIMGNIWMILGISKLVLIIVLFGEDIYRISSGFVDKMNPSIYQDSEFLPSRRKFVSQGALLLAALPLLSLTYGLVKGRYQYKIHRKQIYFKDLPEEFHGFTITQISDIHSGSFDDRDGVLKGIELIKSLNSDLLVFTGDLVNTFSDEFDPWVEDFKTLHAPYGKFSILGNHDYGHYHRWDNDEDRRLNFQKIKEHHKNAGFRLLLDESLHISKNGQTMRLAGVENWGVGFGEIGNIDKALEGCQQDEFTILLSHDPTHWEEVVKKHNKLVHLTMSGHTHGMQMGIDIKGFKWSPIQYRYPKWADLHHENGRYLYINRGFGVLGYRGRVGIWPEITQIQLLKAEA